MAGLVLSTGVPSVQDKKGPAAVTVKAGAAAKAVLTVTLTGRIMSISSWLRMWQCHTYSQPKLTIWLMIGATGLPFASVLLKPASVPLGPFTEPLAPRGIIGFSGRTLSGAPNGIDGTIGRMAT